MTASTIAHPQTPRRLCPSCQKPLSSKQKTYCSYSCRNVDWNRNYNQAAPDAEERRKKYQREYRQRNIKKIRAQQRGRKQRPEDRERKTLRNAQHVKELRHAAIMAYGGYSCNCDHNGQPCGPKPSEFLALDHINGEGKAKGEKGGYKLYGRLKKAGYPPGFRVLCHNCNSALGFYGHCPLSQTEKQPRKRGNASRNIAAQGASVVLRDSVNRPEVAVSQNQRQAALL